MGFTFVPCPYERKQAIDGRTVDAWRCLHCKTVCLTILGILHHCYIEHGIWKAQCDQKPSA